MKPRRYCKVCGKMVGLPIAIYCSNKCQQEERYLVNIARWKAGEIPGAHGDGTITGFVRRYLIERDGERCSECGWDKTHPVTGRVPLQGHHVNGDPTDHSEQNLRLLCPNCHSLTTNFGNLNRGKGRKQRYSKVLE